MPRRHKSIGAVASRRKCWRRAIAAPSVSPASGEPCRTTLSAAVACMGFGRLRRRRVCPRLAEPRSRLQPHALNYHHLSRFCNMHHKNIQQPHSFLSYQRLSYPSPMGASWGFSRDASLFPASLRLALRPPARKLRVLRQGELRRPLYPPAAALRVLCRFRC